MTEFSELVGKTLTEILVSDDKETVTIKCSDGTVYRQEHFQDCCEHVSVEDVAGDLADLIGAPILRAEERSNDDPEASESGTWTFYEMATIKGSATIRWYGSSNGYYSERVSFSEVTAD